MALTFEQARVAAHREWADGLFSLVLDRSVPFTAGQFLTLSKDPEAGRGSRRAYSIASAPGQPLEFLVIEVDDGAVSPGLSALRPGDPLWTTTRGKGLFGLAEVPTTPRRLWMVATGTGVAPYISMLREGTVLERFDEVVLVYGVRQRGHLAYLDDLHALQARGGFRIIDLVSREDPLPGGLPGRITDRFRSGDLERALGHQVEADDTHVMLCGNPAMITDMMALLAERGMRRHSAREPGHITTEKYW
jgi:ferredoxin--NADP+ reductase